MLISIDHGNSAIKTMNYSFISGLSEHTVKPPITDEILEYDGRYWTLSSKRLNYMKDKTQDERYFILTLFAIAKELEAAGKYTPVETIDPAVGLPPEHYGVLKDRFAKYFKRENEVRFIYKDRPYCIIINNVMVFPQAYAAVIPQSSLVINTLRVFIADIGGYTADVLLLRSGKPDMQFCRSLEAGIITMNICIIFLSGIGRLQMIKDGKYRFSLQFASDADNQIRAGEFLERLGNRKSCIIVEAINEYIDNHPELENTQRKIEIKINSSSAYSKEKIEQMIRVLVEEKLSLIQASNGAQKDGETTSSETMDRDIATMLDNIELF